MSMKTVTAAVLAAAVLAVSSPAPAQDYILGEGDLLKITVYENEDLETTTRVSGDGAISFPLVGEVDVGGMSVRDVERRLTRLLADGYIIDPHVSAFVEEYRSKKVTILGEVEKPGLYELKGSATLLEIISMAEGLTKDAGCTAVIKRAGADGAGGEYISVSLKDLMEKGDAGANRAVMDKDSIFVTKSGFVYVLGEVQKPGAFKVEEGSTVMKAIALAGGLTDKAAPGRTIMIRKEGETEKVFSVEMSCTVMPDDLISVPESFF